MTPLFLALLLPVVAMGAEEAPVVHVATGGLRGRVVAQPDGAPVAKYYSFEGIPYARPPVGPRRFKDPEEAEPWSGIRNAAAPGAICIQKNLKSAGVKGEEDCLFINVFTADPPATWSEVKRPVMVRVHGGAFVVGSGNFDFLKPTSILAQQVVLVSFNYRLGVMGFLNTENQEAPGNAGLKDAVIALRWVQKNIKKFGGDPEKVTILGESAGAAIVNYLLITPLTKGLFHRAISMSGAAQSAWASVDNPRRLALRLRSHFAARCPDADVDAVVPCLQSVDARELVAQHDNAKAPEMEYRMWNNSFLPSVEHPEAGPTPFLTAEPEQLMKNGSFHRVPYITGFTGGEGIIYFMFAKLLEDESKWRFVEKHLEDIFRHEMPRGLRTADDASEMRRFYMGNFTVQQAKDNPEALRRFIQMVGDVMFDEAAVSTARRMAEKGASVYVYEFTHDGAAPFKRFINASHVPGVAHGEDMGYLFDFQGAALGPADRQVKERRVRLFTDFAKFGNPTPEGTNSTIWPPYNADTEKYMEMGTEFTIKDHVMQDRIVFWRQLAAKAEADSVTARVEQGLLRGRVVRSAAGCRYSAFRGIPYVRAPLGYLRFRDAQPATPWSGVRDALQEGSECPQTLTFFREGVKGDEDCLYLNVYSPVQEDSVTPEQTAADRSGERPDLPVLVWIHGGGFVQGSGDASSCGPDFLVCEDIVLVTFNYRLGPLGFLYLDEAAPGNAGLKDQVMALRWVQKNIAAFGGDPHKITIAGESAGAASVHFHMLSPLSKGLFQRAIAQSGTALSPWARQREPSKAARTLAAAAGCPALAAPVAPEAQNGSLTATPEYTDASNFSSAANDAIVPTPDAVVNCLRSVPARQLILTTKKAMLDEGQNKSMEYSFVPTEDFQVPGIETFLPEPALKMVENGLQEPVPFIAGFTSKEALLFVAYKDFRNDTIATAMESEWNRNILPQLRSPPVGDRAQEAIAMLRQFYLAGKPLSNDTAFGYIDMLSDITFGEGIFFVAGHSSNASKAPLYLYSFNVDDELNFLKKLVNLTDMPGAAHADDLGYLFKIDGLPETDNTSTAALARQRMVRMWSNFVKTGNPTPVDDPLLRARWKPYSKTEADFLEIGKELVGRTGFFPERMNFWRNFYATFSPSTSSV